MATATQVTPKPSFLGLLDATVASNASSITIDNIPTTDENGNTIEHLWLHFWGTISADANVSIQINGVTSGYAVEGMYSNGTTKTHYRDDAATEWEIHGNNIESNTPVTFRAYFAGCPGNKDSSGLMFFDGNTSGDQGTSGSGFLINGETGYSSITIKVSTGNIESGSIVQLYSLAGG